MSPQHFECKSLWRPCIVFENITVCLFWQPSRQRKCNSSSVTCDVYFLTPTITVPSMIELKRWTTAAAFVSEPSENQISYTKLCQCCCVSCSACVFYVTSEKLLIHAKSTAQVTANQRRENGLWESIFMISNLYQRFALRGETFSSTVPGNKHHQRITKKPLKWPVCAFRGRRLK